MAALILWRNSSTRPWRSLFSAALLVTWGATYTLLPTSFKPIYGSSWWVAATVELVAATSLQAFCFLFPDGSWIPRWARAMWGVWVLMEIPYFLLPDTRVSPLSWHPISAAILGGGILGGCIYGLVYRFRYFSDVIERQQTKWVMFGLTAAALGYFGVNWFFVFTPPERIGYLMLANTILYIVELSIPLTIGFAILRYRLFDIDLIISRTLTYGALTALVSAVYVAVVGALGLLFQAQGNLTVALIGTCLVAVLVQPLHRRLQTAVNRLIYGERDDPYAVINRLGQQLEASLEPDKVLPGIVQTVQESLRIPYAAITLFRDDEFEEAATAGEPVADVLSLPLAYQNQTLGQLIVGARAPGEPFGESDQRLLEGLARQAGVAVHAMLLTLDLQRSRERLITAREEERRRLRRDLHDGLGPALAAQKLKAGFARELVREDPEAAEQLLEQLEQEIKGGLTEVRRLVYNLRPPSLDEFGLLRAIEQAAGQYGAQLEVTVQAPEQLPTLPAAVEVAAFRIVQEALTNVVRHAQARHCQITLRCDNGLHLIITDDGAGIDPLRPAGVGFASMRERAVELGGTWKVMSNIGGGTVVQVWLPLLQEGIYDGNGTAG